MDGTLIQKTEVAVMPTLVAAIDARQAAIGASQFEQGTRKIENSARRADMAVERLDNKMSAMEATGRFLRRSLLLVSGAFLGFQILGSVTRVVGGFEEQMKTVEAITGASANTMDTLSEKARELGATTRFTAAETASAMVVLSRAGFTVNETFDTVEQTLNLSIAGFIDLAQSADILASTMAQFNLVATDSERIANVLVNTTNSTQSQVSELSETMKFAGAIAGNLGISLEETAAAAGVLADSNIRASLAGTNLRGILGTLLNPSKEALKIFEQMGLTAEDLDPSLNSLADIFEKLRDAQITEAEAGEIFKKRNFTASLILANNVDSLRALTTSNENAEGSAREFASTVDDTLIGSLRSLQSSFQEVLIVIGNSKDGLGGSFRFLVDVFTDILRIIGGVDDAWENAGTTAKVLTAATVGLTAATAAYIALRFGAYMLTVADSIGTARTAMRGLNTAISRNPIGFLAVTVGAVAASMFLLRDSTEETSAAMHNAVEAAQEYSARLKEAQSVQDKLRAAQVTGDPRGQTAALNLQIAQYQEAQKVIAGLSRTRVGYLNRPGDAFERRRAEELDMTVEAYRRFTSTAGNVVSLQKQVEEGWMSMADASAEAARRAELARNSIDLSTLQRQIGDVYNVDFSQIDQKGTTFYRSSPSDEIGEVVELEDALDLLQKTIITTEEEIEIIKKSMEDAAGATRMASEDYKAQQKALKNLDEFMGQLQVEAVTSRLNDLEAAVYESNLEIFRLGRTAGLTGQEIVTLQLSAEELIKRIYANKEAADAATDSIDEMAKAQERANDAFESAQNAIGDALFKQNLIGEDESFVQIEQQVRSFEKALRDSGVAFSELNNLSDIYRSIITENQRLTQEEERRLGIEERLEDRRRSARSGLREMAIDLRTERELVGLTNEQREKELFMMEAKNLVAASGLPFQGALLKNLEDEFDELQRLQRIEKISRSVGDAVSDMFSDIILSANSASEAIENFGRTMLNIIFQQTVGEGLSTAVTGITRSVVSSLIPSNQEATGGVYSGGVRQAFAMGGVVSGPTYFPMAGGVGLMGEAGPEAIMPLRRGPGGRLGVEASGEQQSMQVTQNFNFPPGTDVTSFKRNMRQVKAAAMGSATRVKR